MEIVDYWGIDAAGQERVRERIGRSEWSGAKFLKQLLEEGRLKTLCGPFARLLLGMEGETLAAFCTLADRDDVDAPDMSPWIGFVYTFPEYRGCRRSGELIAHACNMAKDMGFGRVCISTNETGLYEKYGFTFAKMMKDVWRGDTRVYCREL